MEGCKRRIAARRPSLQSAPLIQQVETARLFPTSRILERKTLTLSPANIAPVEGRLTDFWVFSPKPGAMAKIVGTRVFFPTAEGINTGEPGRPMQKRRQSWAISVQNPLERPATRSISLFKSSSHLLRNVHLEAFLDQVKQKVGKKEDVSISFGNLN